MASKFPLGRTVITAHARDVLNPADIPAAMARHAAGDWGEVCEADRRENDFSVERGFRILSAYHDALGTKFWIIVRRDGRNSMAG